MTNKEVVRQVIDAFLNADAEKALTHMTDNVRMGWPGYFDLAPGKDAIRKFFSDIPEIVSGNIESLIAEGNKVAGTGTVSAKQKDGSLRKSFFCDVYELEGGKVAKITSYMVFDQANVEA